MHVIGTAGHVDHGKTALIHALTGVDTDRLPEEKLRGLTIDLGFAHFESSDGSPVGVVDVPGHERFIRNMVAGAVNIDCALLVVAADEGWMIQTTDHARVLALLDIPNVIPVITKCDLVDDDASYLVASETVDRLERIGPWRVRCEYASVADRASIDRLRVRIEEELQSIDIQTEGKPRIDVDRVFTVQGSGTVVTGTLRGGPLQSRSDVTILPTGAVAHIRTLRTYFEEVEEGVPTCRIAANLRGIDADSISRGMVVVTDPAEYRVVDQVVIELCFADERSDNTEHVGSPGDEHRSWTAPRSRTKAELAVGTGHVLADVTPMSRSDLVHLTLPEPVAFRYEQSCVLIRHGGSEILCGGRVIWRGESDAFTRRRISEEFDHLRRDGGSVDPLEFRLRVFGYLEAGYVDMLHDTGIEKVSVDGYVLDSASVERWVNLITNGLERGPVPRTKVPHMLHVPADVAVAVCSLFEKRRIVDLQGEKLLAPSTSKLQSLTPFGRKLLKDLETSGRTGLEPSKLKMNGAKKELNVLCRAGFAKSLDGTVFYHIDTYRRITTEILAGRKTGETLTIGHARENTGLSRKYLIPLLNCMEAEALVRREGDVRIVL